MTVYVVQPSAGKNITPALQYGQLVHVIDRDVDPLLEMDFILKEAERKLANFVPEDDYLLLIGDPVVIAAVVAILTNVVWWFKTLKWDKQDRRYVEITVDCYTEEDE
jgi:hypothetical protein